MLRHVEPDAEAAGGAAIAIAIAEDLVGEVELEPIKPPVLLDMRLVAIGRDRHVLERHGYLGRRDIAQLVKHREELPVAGGEANPHARQVRAFRQRLKRDRICKIRPGAFQHAAGRYLRIDFRIAFVAQNHEAEPVGELFQTAEIFPRRHGALRVCRRSDVDCDRSRQRGVIERIEVGEESIGQRGRQIDRFAACGTRPGRVSRIKRIRYQDRGPAPALADVARRGECCEKQALAASVQHQKLGFRIDRPRQLEPGGKPARGCPPERFDALGDGIAAEVGDVLGQHRADKGRNRVLRLA